ncbi:Prolipoprotein diacylglyceryl transferase [Anaerohalosphaera lusitana]|uniref:Phosphatidylglycerol--prolipoprotein diacylglyceryl transferase n=1 Tax=Anaerohalosphaera lusitana TaxID=1936003 RepID=A0A1U9NMQ4_9BACT|nr:prolipoprotein diacylglyceryl transferase [Anaerohalosphaera lusitana]AQT69008.1 Prolipoprotein diacylglyceryl transferase [Anaerohalosphaera lusitana]
MQPELFEIPFIHVTLKSYGLMMVIGFLVAMFVMRRMAAHQGEDPANILNVALYSLLAGVIGARLFYVVHHAENIDSFGEIFAVWQGGLEFLGGVLFAAAVVGSYLWFKKLNARKYGDMIAVGLMIGLAFGRIGCFLNGCCFGAITENPLGVQFPYGSPPYQSQAYPDSDRQRDEAVLDLPPEYYGGFDEHGHWVPAQSDAQKHHYYLKPKEKLTEQQQEAVKNVYSCRPVHPTQLYASANGLLLAGVLFLFWRRFRDAKPGWTFSLMLILYGTTRFVLESIRADNPFEYGWWALYKGGTVSQNIGIYMVITGLVLFYVFNRMSRSSRKPT